MITFNRPVIKLPYTYLNTTKNITANIMKADMAGSSSTSYPWTSKKIDAALAASVQAVRGGKEDPFLERNIMKAVSKLNATDLFNSSTSGEVLTAEALRTLLYQQRERYRRVCEIADLPYCVFSRFYYKIKMLPNDYENHIQVCRDLEIVKVPLIVNLKF
jgi:hypothetical protein